MIVHVPLLVVPGKPVTKTGAVVSRTVTVVVAVAMLPEASVAEKVTVVVPRGKTARASLVTTGAASELSVAVGRDTMTGVPFRFVCSIVIGAGTSERTGGSESTTDTVNMNTDLWPVGSVTVSVTSS